MKLSLEQAAQAMNARPQAVAASVATGVSIDTRTLAPGQLFFAVRGERLDGHDFVEQAFQRGAVAAVVEQSQASRFPDRPLLIVSDTLLALQDLALSVRRAWGKTVVGITGSAGKTTTKELIAAVLGTRFRVLKSEGNLNNHFGLPLQLLRLEDEHDVAVIEMGMSHAREITRLAEIAQPNVGVVTCVAPVHLGYFKSVAEIAKAKKELVDSLPADGIAVLNADDGYVSKFGLEFAGRVVTYGAQVPADVRAETITSMGGEGSRFEAVAGAIRTSVVLPLLGEHNVYNALAAMAAGIVCGVTPEEAAAALAEVRPADKRGQILEIAGATVVNDCYNSNPKALEAMIDALTGLRSAGRRIVVAGEMLELGPATEDLHRRCGQHAARKGVDVLIGVRGAARYIVEAAAANDVDAKFVETPAAAGEWLAREVRPGDAVLLKASRGVKLEAAIEIWKERAHLRAAK